MEINKVKIRFGKPKFGVNPHTGVVECTLRWDFNSYPYTSIIYNVLEGGYKSFHEITATAKLNEGDKFDALKGKKIAQAKAEIKAYKQAYKIVTKVNKNLAELVSLNYQFLAKATNTIAHDEEFIAKQ